MTLNKKWLLTLIFAAFVSLLAACGSDEGESAKGDNNKEEQKQEEQASEDSQQKEMPKPDLEGVPDVVAKVNGEEIKKAEFENVYKGQFQQMAMQSQMSGQKVDQDKLKKQVADSLVGQELLIQEADSRDYKAPQEEKDKKLEELAKQRQVKSTDEFLKKLEEQGMSKEEVMTQVGTQIKLDKLIAEEAGDTEPTEEEVKKAYDQMKAQQEKAENGQEVPAYEEVKDRLKDQLKKQKESEATQKLVKNLREEADVTVNI
ncbi:SurA N-terminal domain-containing protein [Halobacillus sp. H74]|uniref:SurA N-terminal domain-containing protein n=1 Tax=Halobacillus sp. H74 TaxID=3457436 RepID=UPI003FCDD3EC